MPRRTLDRLMHMRWGDMTGGEHHRVRVERRQLNLKRYAAPISARQRGVGSREHGLSPTRRALRAAASALRLERKHGW